MYNIRIIKNRIHLKILGKDYMSQEMSDEDLDFHVEQIKKQYFDE